MSRGTPVITLRLDQKVQQKLEMLCFYRKRNMSEILREAINEYLAYWEREPWMSSRDDWPK